MGDNLRVAVQTVDGKFFNIEMAKTATFGNLKEQVGQRMLAPAGKLKLVYKEDDSIPDTEKLVDQGVVNDDMLLVLMDGQRLQQVQQPAGGAQALAQAQAQAQGQGGIMLSDGRIITAEQARLMAAERMKEIQRNYEQAMEENPASFASVYMLYVDVVINDVPVKAFVDSGAQTTVMSKECAERTGIIQLCDPRFAGVAQGVGVARILGRVHLAPMKIQNNFYDCSYAIMDSAQKVELLIGLDMLRKHNCIIDLTKNALVIHADSEFKNEVPFLSEDELPEYAKLTQANMVN